MNQKLQAILGDVTQTRTRHASVPTTAPRSTTSRDRQLRRSLLLSAGTLLVMLVSCELATRTYALVQGRGFAHDPKVFTSPFFTTEDWPAPFKNGLRYEFKDGDSITAAEAQHSVVAVCLGGSTTLSRNAEGKAYPRILESLLRDRLKPSPIRVMNAGGNAFATPHSFVNFSLRILTPDLKPDIIVVYHNINDLGATFLGSETLPDYANKYMTDYYLAYPHKTGALSPLLRHSRFFRFVYYRSRLLGYSHNRAPDSDYAAGAQYFERNLRSIAAVAAANDVGVVFGTQPARAALRQLKSHQLYNAIVRKVAAEFDGGLADVAAEIIDDERDFIDDIHYSPTGVDRVARVFLPEVEKLAASRLARLKTPSPPSAR